MRSVPDCIPDILRDVLRVAWKVSDDTFIHHKVLTKVMAELVDKGDASALPEDLAFESLEVAYKALGARDPFKEDRESRLRTFLGAEARLLASLQGADDPVAAGLAVLAHAWGGDLTEPTQGELPALVEGWMNTPLERDDRSPFLEACAKAKSLMLVLDTVDTVVPAKLFLQMLPERVTRSVVVAAKPLQMQATREDAEAAGCGAGAEVLDPGASMLGISLSRCAKEFRERFRETDLVLVLGDTNYETLVGCDREFYACLPSACPDLARRIGVRQGTPVCMRCHGDGKDRA